LPTLRVVKIRAWLQLAAIGLALVGCDRRVEPYIPPDQELPRIEGPVRVPGLGNPAAERRVLASSPAPPPTTAPASRSDGASIRGMVRLASGVKAPDGAVVFVTARPAGGGGLLAALQLPASSLPHPFELGPADVMIPGRSFQGPIVVRARLDLDGDPVTRSPDDLVASLSSPVEPGASGVDLVLAPPLLEE
jgi:hypothetical protein